MIIYHLLSLVLEIGTTAAFSLGTWGFFRETDELRIPAAVFVFVALIMIWSMFLMRQAPKRLSMPLLAVVIVSLAVGAVLILAFCKFRLFASILGVTTIADVLLLVFLWKRYPELVSDFSPRETSGLGSTRRAVKRNAAANANQTVRPAQTRARQRPGEYPSVAKRPSRRRR